MNKPTEAPKTAEPEPQVSIPKASDKQPEEPVTATPPEIPDLRVDDTIANPSTSAPSNSPKLLETHNDDVLITGTGFVEPGNPISLAKHTHYKKYVNL